MNEVALERACSFCGSKASETNGLVETSTHLVACDTCVGLCLSLWLEAWHGVRCATVSVPAVLRLLLETTRGASTVPRTEETVDAVDVRGEEAMRPRKSNDRLLFLCRDESSSVVHRFEAEDPERAAEAYARRWGLDPDSGGMIVVVEPLSDRAKTLECWTDDGGKLSCRVDVDIVARLEGTLLSKRATPRRRKWSRYPR